MWGEATKLKAPAANRWSSVTVMLQSFLEKWPAIFRALHNHSKRNPLKAQRDAVLQVYSVLVPINKTIKLGQASNASAGPMFLLSVASLLTESLALEKALPIIDPQALREAKEKKTVPEKKKLQQGELLPVARELRRLAREGLVRRWVKDRYNGDLSSDFLLDAATLAHPGYVAMAWVDSLSDIASGRP
jgi:hypothetical protein